MPYRQLIIYSGGQTGVDAAALSWAITNGFQHSGWCPQGWRSEAGVIPSAYQLRETPSQDYRQRTEWNVRDTDATVVISFAPQLSGGSKLTEDFARNYQKPFLHLAAERENEDHAALLREFIQQHRVTRLNVAGPRASSEPRVADFVWLVLNEALLDAPFAR